MKQLLILLLLVGCASVVPKPIKYPNVSTELKPYIEQFNTYYKVYRHSSIQPTIVVELGEIPDSKSASGVYRRDTDQTTISINHWITLDNMGRFILISHELGHHILKRNHDFSESYQKKFTKLKRHVYVIDEAQKSTLFHKKFYNAEVFYVFEFSRHLGIDFFLITQDLWKLSPGLVNLPEIHIKVQRRSLAVFRNSFTYMYMSDRDVLKKMSLKKDPRVFAAYRSQRVAVRDTLKSFSRRYILIFGLLFCSVAGGFYMFTKSFFWTMERSSKNKKVVNHVEKVEKKMLAVVGDYVFYNVGGKVLKEKK